VIENSENRSLLIRNNAIDGLRAVAVIAVILYHLSVSLLPHGFLGVDIFFVISGYVVCSSLLRRPKESLGRFFAGFYSRRILRIYPALIACLLVTGLFAAMFIPDSFVLEKHQQRACGPFSD
jgi:peptidoglycan/LPS O-acetylase OafA/YrhL